ncbi:MULTISPECIES: HAMP domain-containing sensor histidine kinase [unclassified Kitasatospora]|uniref:sensor histidine kinase n=1 Tax=unclassified Kitasatospora TaxID=2633591 RepID=UPI000709D1A6|nr:MULTISPECIES: HAMP domain-containing sensor histidine kinase [unclassified Kitasatospora]KQV21299.1 histidine kinase [Kitasatospora sp. Root107]KRB69486.1 histidine kinase [Kitasatospora sp. Root187]
MRTRLLGILLSLMTAVLAALGVPLGAAMAAAEQSKVVVDRMDDAARFAQSLPTQGRPTAGTAVKGDPTPVDGDGGRLHALVGEVQRYHELYGIKVGIFHRDGSAVAVAPADWQVPTTGSGSQAFQEAVDGRRSQNPPQAWPWTPDRTLTVAAPVVRDGDVIAVVITESPTGALRHRILYRWLGIGAGESLAMIAAILLSMRLTGWVLRPVRTLDRATHDIATGRMNARVAPSSGPPELRRLARSFNDMADNVLISLDQQRAFVADASHQLRNPLAALLLRVELLGLELPEGHDAELGAVREEGVRLARVLDDLLGLATAEHARPEPEHVDLADLALARIDAWQQVANQRGIQLGWDGPATAVGLADPIGFGSALDAVLDNALKFTPSGGAVRLGVERGKREVTLTVSDAGPGLTEEELARIGDRFWRSPRHQNVDGSGLGLSIARTLLLAGGGSLDFAPVTPTGLSVHLTVPRPR